MLPFQKTTLYRKSVNTVNEVLKTFEREHGTVLKKKIEEEALTLTTSLAKTLSGAEDRFRTEDVRIPRESTLGLISLMDMAGSSGTIQQQEAEKLIAHLEELAETLENFGHSRKKVLILCSQIGQGHMSAAKAVHEAILHLYGYDIDVETIDFMEFINSGLTKVTQKTYDSSAKFAPVLCKLFFESTDKKWPIKLLNRLNYPFVLSKLKKFFEEKKPDLIVSTFPLWDYVTAEVWKKNYKNAKFISIVTDSITIHNGWVVADSDYHIVANEDTANSLKRLGADEKKIKPFGFPVRMNFLEKFDRKSFLSRQGLDPDKFTVLYLPTALNPRKNIKIMNELVRDSGEYNLIVVTGRDMKSKPKMQKLAGGGNVRVIGWTDEMPLFIRAADVVVTKAGGATVMECIAAEKPMVITFVIPGQEQGNAEYIKQYQLGIVANDAGMDISECIAHIRKNYGTFHRNLQKVSKPRAALKIAEFIHELLS